jgi:hypothetical protein
MISRAQKCAGAVAGSPGAGHLAHAARVPLPTASPARSSRGPTWRAMYPSSQSVKDAPTNSAAHHSGDDGSGVNHSVTSTGTATRRAKVRMLGTFCGRGRARARARGRVGGEGRGGVGGEGRGGRGKGVSGHRSAGVRLAALPAAARRGAARAAAAARCPVAAGRAARLRRSWAGHCSPPLAPAASPPPPGAGARGRAQAPAGGKSQSAGLWARRRTQPRARRPAAGCGELRGRDGAARGAPERPPWPAAAWSAWRRGPGRRVRAAAGARGGGRGAQRRAACLGEVADVRGRRATGTVPRAVDRVARSPRARGEGRGARRERPAKIGCRYERRVGSREVIVV